jgi:hypothetical protein
MPSFATLVRSRVRRVLHRSRAYKRLFTTPNGLSEDAQIVLAHLKRFAKYGKPPVALGKTGATDMFEVGRMVGRQEVVQLIVEALHLEEKTLTNLQEEFDDE